MKKIILSITLLLTTSVILFAQNVGIGTNTPDASAILELNATNKGFLPPQMTALQKTNIPAPKKGLMIYQTDGVQGLYIYDGSAWVAATASGSFVDLATAQTINGVKTFNADIIVNGVRLGKGNSNGNFNTALGDSALNVNTSGVYNTATGYQSLANNNTGILNAANGYRSLFGNTFGNYNTAMGNEALKLNSTGFSNSATGFQALTSNSSGNNNTANGTFALVFNTTGFSNVAVGRSALQQNTDRSNLVAVGDSALFNNGTGAANADDATGNTAIGSKALTANTTGKNNTAIGFQALKINTAGSNNTTLGSNADLGNNSLNNATAIGSAAQANCNDCMVLGSVSGVNGASSSVNVGVGTTSPLMRLHIAKNDSAVALLENTQALNTNVSNALYFKTGSGILSYTGAVKTIGENTGAARLGMFTSTAFSANGLLERMSITDNGYVGIGTINPLMKLHVTKTDSAVALFENSQFLNTNVSTALYFKTGNGTLPYTGAIKTIGESTGAARLGLFTFTAASGNGLKERLSITDAGNVGIDVTAPQTDLHINPAGAGSLLIGTNKYTGLYTNIEMGITAQTNGYGYLQATKASGSSYGTLAINENGGNVGIGTSQVAAAAKLTVGVNAGIGGNYAGIVTNANGNANNAALKAVGTNSADALDIDGPIRILNTNDRVIYTMTTQTSNSSADGYLNDYYTAVPGNPDGLVTILINNPLCNGDPTAIIFFTFHGYYENNRNYQPYLTYSNAIQRWEIQYHYDNYIGGATNYAPKLNIMIVKQ